MVTAASLDYGLQCLLSLQLLLGELSLGRQLPSVHLRWASLMGQWDGCEKSSTSLKLLREGHALEPLPSSVLMGPVL